MQHRNVSSSQFLVTQAVGAITGDMWFETQTVNIEGDFSYVAFDSTEEPQRACDVDPPSTFAPVRRTAADRLLSGDRLGG